MDTTITADPIVKVEPDASDTESAVYPTTTATNTATEMNAAIAVDPIIKAEPGISDTRPVVDLNITATNTAIKMEANLAQTVRVLKMGDTHSQNIQQMMIQGRSILTLCRNSRDSIKPDRTEEMKNRFAYASLYLDWLDTNIEMTPQINTTTRVERVLQDLMKLANHVPESLANKAKALFNKYEVDNWGQDDVADQESGAAAATQSPAIAGGSCVIQLPSPDDPTFGVHGIMYGIITDTSGKRRDYRLRPDIPRKSAKVYGHNGIALGAWFPFQINTLFWGAHGARMGGIAGSVTTGAWSIVVADTYGDLDTDHGDTLYYSGSNSHDNKDPNNAAKASQGTNALLASYRTQKPVRVLRSGGAPNTRKRNVYLPSCGLRYDGLYLVVHYGQRHNKNGGLYDQFKLERLADQTPLAELRRKSPTKEQRVAREGLN